MIITLLSDFGDVYPASMKGVILGISPGANIVDISHSILRHDIRAGAFILMTTAKYYPSGTVHIAVVDPGVGTKRRAIAIKAESGQGDLHYFIGPDNGLLIPAARSMGKMEVHEISNTSLFRENISNTFHGRDIFAPVGAYISKGLDICKTGKHIIDYRNLDFGIARKREGCLSGEVIYIDAFGNIITNIPGDLAGSKPGDQLEIGKKKLVFCSSYGFLKENDPLILTGSHGYLEIAVNMGNAAKMFSKKNGDEIYISSVDQ